MPPLEIIFNIVVIGISFVYWVIAFIIVYHLNRFGIGVQPKKFAMIFLFGSLVLASVSTILFTKVDITMFIK